MTTEHRNPIEATTSKFQDTKPTYGFASTAEILGKFETAGWIAKTTQIARVNKEENEGFQRHLIRLEHADYVKMPGLSVLNESRPQLIIANSHNGTSTLRIQWGMFRLVCLNGAIAGSYTQGVRLVHSKTIIDKLPEAITFMLESFPTFTKQIETMQNRTLTAAAQQKLIKKVYDERLKAVAHVHAIDYVMPRLRRAADDAADAYTVFNRLQEVLLRGGIHYQQTIEDRIVRKTTRAMGSVNAQLKLNQLVYDTTMELVG